MSTSILNIQQAAQAYVQTVQTARRLNTYKTYKNAVALFLGVLEQHAIPLSIDPASLPDESINWTISALKDYSVATERLYLTAIAGFFEFLFAEQLGSPNLPRIKSLINRRARRPTQRLPQFPSNDIAVIIDYVINIAPNSMYTDKRNNENLRLLRDKAFILVLADTGLRVHEACNLDRGSIDWAEAKAIVEIKGGRESIVRFSERSLVAMRSYITARAAIDGASGRPLTSLPLFARHDRGAGKKVKRITPTTGRNIINHYVAKVLGQEAIGTITPHSFRHYFVTVVLKASGNLKLAQELARHKNIAVTQRYAHLSDDELDKGYHGIFNPPETHMEKPEKP
jgi:site-specific recombinase XerD